MSFVIDNSVAMAWCFEDERTQAEVDLLKRVAETGAKAPQLWPIEALNGLLTAERRGRIDAHQRRHLFGLLQELPIDIDDETAGRAWNSIVLVAETHRLTAYDAAYLELALRLNVPLATRDKALFTAAQSVGVALLPAG